MRITKKTGQMKTIGIILGSILITNGHASIDTPQSVLNMKVTTDGIYRVHHTDILAQGIDVSGVLKSQIAIYNKGELVPVKISSDNESTFGAQGQIEFVGLSEQSLYQNGSIYSIVIANNTLIKHSEISTDVNQLSQQYYHQQDTYGENNDYSYGAPISDPWYHKRMLAFGSEVSETMAFEIDQLDPTGGNIELEMTIWGGTDYLQTPDHHVRYELNGQEIDDFWFDGIIADVKTYSLDSDQMSNGIQQLSITLPGDTNTAADVMHIESWKVSYPRAYVMHQEQLDFNVIDNHSSPSETLFANGFEVAKNRYEVDNASNKTYSVYKVFETGEVKSYASQNKGSCHYDAQMGCQLEFSIDNSAGRVFIASETQVLQPEMSLPVLLTEIKEDGLVDILILTHADFNDEHMQEFIASKSGYSVKVVDVEQIYAQYNHGNISAQSISQYIQHAKAQFDIKNVILVGGDTYDYKDNLGLGTVSFIPTLYGATDELITYAPIDAKYADINNDDIPDINIGRFPVRTSSEFLNLTQKISAYESKDYGYTSLFAADKYDVSNGYSFKDDAEFLIAQLPQSWKNNISVDTKAYIDDDGVEGAKIKISNQINQGVALTSFIGHSGPRDWSFSRMFSAGDAHVLSNSTHPTLVTQWGCWNTYFVSPEEDTLAHAFMLNQNGGAASVLGASTLTKAEHEKALAQLVLSYLADHQMTLGDAVTLAKQTYAITKPDATDVILGWTILGDPTLRL